MRFLCNRLFFAELFTECCWNWRKTEIIAGCQFILQQILNFQERLRKSTEILRNILGLDICQRWRVDILVDNQSPPSSSQRVANRQPRSGSSSERTRRAEPGVRVGLAKIARACLCAHAAYSSKRLSARDESGISAKFLRRYVFQNSA